MLRVDGTATVRSAPCSLFEASAFAMPSVIQRARAAGAVERLAAGEIFDATSAAMDRAWRARESTAEQPEDRARHARNTTSARREAMVSEQSRVDDQRQEQAPFERWAPTRVLETPDLTMIMVTVPPPWFVAMQRDQWESGGRA